MELVVERRRKEQTLSPLIFGSLRMQYILLWTTAMISITKQF